MNKTDRRAEKRHKAIYGHYGIGATHVREASEAEVRHHWRQAVEKRNRGKK